MGLNFYLYLYKFFRDEFIHRRELPESDLQIAGGKSRARDHQCSCRSAPNEGRLRDGHAQKALGEKAHSLPEVLWRESYCGWPQSGSERDPQAQAMGVVL